MPTAVKAAAVAELRDAFSSSSAAVLTEYRGLTVAQLKDLRRLLAGNATYAVVKNTLTKIAAADAGIPGFDALLEGPSAIAFVNGDPVAVAKGIRDFSRTFPFLVIKGGVLDGRPLSADEVRRLADLESREVLLARAAGAISAALTAAVSLVAAPLAQAARALAALQAAAVADPAVLAAGPLAAAPGQQGEPATPVSGTADQGSAEKPVAAGDAADAAVAADSLAREVPAEEPAEAATPVPIAPATDDAAPPTTEEPALPATEEPPA